MVQMYIQYIQLKFAASVVQTVKYKLHQTKQKNLHMFTHGIVLLALGVIVLLAFGSCLQCNTTNEINNQSIEEFVKRAVVDGYGR